MRRGAREGWRKSEMRGIFAIPVTKLHPPASDGDAHRRSACRRSALCMRAPRNASGSIRMEFHAVKNPATLSRRSFRYFSPTSDSFLLSAEEPQTGFLVLISMASVSFLHDQESDRRPFRFYVELKFLNNFTEIFIVACVIF